jgi:hypothetical protein
LLAAGAIVLLVACLIAVSGSAVARQRSAPRPALDVLPFPGTPDASPRTQIDFPTLAPAQLRAVAVRGSRSGLHSGRVIARSPGAVFVPARPFQGGEQVTVSATLRSPAAGTASGAPGARRLSFSFSVGTPARFGPTASPATDRPRTAVKHSTLSPASFTHSFHSAPSLQPPVVVVGNKDPDGGSGDIFLDAHRTTQPGPLILDAQGRPVWFDPLPGGQAGYDLSVQNYLGQSVLTFWQGYVWAGWGQGYDVVMDHHYQQIATVHAANGYQADLHEFQITPQGNALITIYSPVKNVDLRSVGGPRNGTLLDSIIQEINIKTGQLIWEWHAYGHVHLNESYAGKPNANPYDFFHINSVQLLPNGDFLVSARHTFAVYEINPTTGKIVWIVGGKHSSYRMKAGTNFEWQHDARLYGWTLTVFDDAAGYRRNESQSRALSIWLHPKSMTATLTRAYSHNPPVLSVSEGNMQLLPNGNVFVGFGAAPDFTEYSSTGRQLFTARFIYPVQFYRAYRFPWWGQPAGQPSIAVTPTTAGSTVYASWNGATDVASWRVLAGSTPNSLAPVAQKGFNGFETGISTSSSASYFRVQALDASGNMLGSSPVAFR